jgi:hypothetical protein
MPEAQPTAEQDVFPQQGYQPQATGADFGAQVGGAEQGFGEKADQASDVLTQTVLRKQGLINEANAQDSDIKFQTDLANLEDKYYSLSGKAAADAEPAFQQSVLALRQQYIGSASNPEEANMLGQSLQFSTVRSMLTAGRYAGEQQKSWIISSADSRAQMLAVQMGRNFGDSNYQTQAIAGIKGAAQNLADANGWSDDQRDLYAQKYIAAGQKAAQEQSIAAFNALPVTSRIQALAGGSGQPGVVGGSGYHALTATIESQGNPDIGTNASGHTGLFQASPEWWKEYGGGGDINNAADQHAALDRETADNLPKLKADLGRPVTNADLYLAHQQGEAGAVALLNNPGKLASEVVPLANISGNLPANSNLDPEAISAKQFTDIWAQPYNAMDSHALQPQADPQLSKAQAIVASLPPDVQQELTKKTLSAWNDQADAQYVQWEHGQKYDAAVAKQKLDQTVATNQQAMMQHDADPSNPEHPAVNLVALSQDPVFQQDPAAFRDLVSFQRALDRPEAVRPGDSAKATQQLFARMALPDGDPNKLTSDKDLTDAFIQGSINKADLGFLQTQFTNARTTDGQRLLSIEGDFLKSTEKMINPTAPDQGTSPFAPMRYYAFTQAVAQKVAEFRAEGKDPAKLFDPTPGNKDYVGSPGFMHPYTRSMTDIMDEINENTESTPEPETPAIPSAEAEPAAPAAPAETSQEKNIPADLPKGTFYYGQTKDGRPVYLLPNGQKVAPAPASEPAATPPVAASTAPTVPLGP